MRKGGKRGLGWSAGIVGIRLLWGITLGMIGDA